MSTHNIQFHDKIRKFPYIFLAIGRILQGLKNECESSKVNKPSVCESSRIFCLFMLRFYGLVNPMGSYRVWSVYQTTRLLDRLSPLSG